MTKKLVFKQKFFTILFSLIAVLAIAFNVNASYKFEDNSGIKELAPSAGYDLAITSPDEYIGRILLFAFSFVGLIFMGLIIYAGIQWMTAQGNTSQVSKAKDTLIKAIVGLVIIMAAYGITFLVVNTFQSPANPVPANDGPFIDSPVNGDDNNPPQA
jgi:amino acid transporter